MMEALYFIWPAIVGAALMGFFLWLMDDRPTTATWNDFGGDRAVSAEHVARLAIRAANYRECPACGRKFDVRSGQEYANRPSWARRKIQPDPCDQCRITRKDQ